MAKRGRRAEGAEREVMRVARKAIRTKRAEVDRRSAREGRRGARSGGHPRPSLVTDQTNFFHPKVSEKIHRFLERSRKNFLAPIDLATKSFV